MAALTKFYGSTIGKKIVVAVTGLILVGFLVGHVSGNLLFFAGQAKLDAYSKFLHESPALLWGTRLVLLVSVALHILATLQLAKLRGEARPVNYQGPKSWISNYATRTMIITGPLIAFFVVYHLLHFTTGHAHPAFKSGEVYANVQSAFSSPAIALVYIISMLILSGHLVHGVWSMFQTIGVNHPKYNALIRRGSVLLAILIVAGFISVPLFVLLGGGR